MTTVLTDRSQPHPDSDATFDRLAQLTAKAVGASAAFVSLADCAEDEIVFAGITGLPEVVPGQRKTLSQTICRHVVASGAPLAVGDTVSDPLARDEAGLHELGIGAYLGVPLRTASGEVIGALCAVERTARPWSDAEVEIAEGLAAAVTTELELRAAAAEACRQADERRAIVEAALDCVVTMDEHGLVREFNPAAERTFGYAREDAIGRSLADLIVPPEFRDAHEAGLRRYLATGESSVLGRRIELTAMRADGSVFPVELSVARLEIGGEAMFVGFIRDLSELHAAEDRYRNLIEKMPLVTYMNSVEDHFEALYMSPQLEGLLGYSAEEWQASPELARTCIHPDDRERVDEIARVARAEGTPTRAEFRFIARDGRVVWVLDHTIPVYDAAGAIVCHQGFLLDITERKQLEEQLRQSQKMDAVGQLAGGIAHDFNNMLTAIGGYADLLAASFEAGDLRADDVEQIRKAAGHAAVLTRQLLSFSRKQMLLPQRLDVNQVVRDLEAMLARTLGGDVRLVTELDCGVAEVEADPDQLVQVVLNIALNGRDAMPDGGSLTIATHAVERESRPFVAVEVSDTGSGMDEETRARVFEPFFTTKEKGKGTGLGLATAYGVVDQSGGRIEVESEPGSGSTFRVLLPAAA
ncbi:MAG TPA: PAS domain S-box protein [Gaiellaceae bacterium]|nr:PAS domain S-box protein [Gaiellaceae bacterium]